MGFVIMILFWILVLYFHYYPQSYIVHSLRAMQEVRLSPRLRGSARRSFDIVFVNQLPGAFDGIRELCSSRPLSQAEIQRWQERIETYHTFSENESETFAYVSSKSDLSKKVANGEIKSTGKSVSIDEVIAKIDKHLEDTEE